AQPKSAAQQSDGTPTLNSLPKIRLPWVGLSSYVMSAAVEVALPCSPVISAAARPVAGIARRALGKLPATIPRSLFLLFYVVEIRHRGTSAVAILAPAHR